jgi:hypothetical protein
MGAALLSPALCLRIELTTRARPTLLWILGPRAPLAFRNRDNLASQGGRDAAVNRPYTPRPVAQPPVTPRLESQICVALCDKSATAKAMNSI